MDDFKTTLNQLVCQSGKSVKQIAYLGGVDEAYLRRLLSGEKDNPSGETIVKIWMGLIIDTALVRQNPTFTEGLASLLLSAALTRATRL